MPSCTMPVLMEYLMTSSNLHRPMPVSSQLLMTRSAMRMEPVSLMGVSGVTRPSDSPMVPTMGLNTEPGS